MNFRPLSADEWQTFGGLEGRGQIAELMMNHMPVIVVAGDNRIEVFTEAEQNWALPLPGMDADQTVRVAKGLFPAIAESTLPLGQLLERFGFVQN